LNELSNLRDLICQKKEIISTIRFGKRELEQDRVKQKLNSLTTRHRCLQERLMGDRTHVHLVMNTDRLSFSEAMRIGRRLADIAIAIDRVVVNKVRKGDRISAIGEVFDADRISVLPLYEQELVGLGVLQAYVGMQHKAFDAFMPGSGC
jgi:arsenite/tail-anchored protein-transporting ATPase